jgi:hypothetical protein
VAPSDIPADIATMAMFKAGKPQGDDDFLVGKRDEFTAFLIIPDWRPVLCQPRMPVDRVAA